MLDPLLEKFGLRFAESPNDKIRLSELIHETCCQTALDDFAANNKELHEIHEKEARLFDFVYQIISSQSEMRKMVIDWLLSNMNDLDAPSPPTYNNHQYTDEYYAYIFELLLREKFQEAVSFCELSKNFSLQAVLNAVSHNNDKTNLSNHFFKVCREMAHNSELHPHERGIYGFICNDIASVVSLCESWEELLLCVYRLGLSTRTYEQILDQKRDQLLSPSNEWFQNIILSLIKNTFPQLVAELVSEIHFVFNSHQSMEDDASQLSQSVLVNSPWLARIILHVQICLGLEISEDLVKFYIELLCVDPASLSTGLIFVPEYVKLLNSESQIEVYSYVISQINDDDEICKQIEIAKNHDINLEPVIKEAQTVNVNQYMESPTLDMAKRVITSTKALILAELWKAAAQELPKIYELFFLNNSFDAVILLNNSIGDNKALVTNLSSAMSSETEGDEVLDNLTKFMQYRVLANAYSAINKWTQQQPITQWSYSLGKTIEEAIESVDKSLNFNGKEEIKTKCIPQLVYELLGLLNESAKLDKKYTKASLDLAVLIADEKRQLYKLFDSNLLNMLVAPAIAYSNLTTN